MPTLRNLTVTKVALVPQGSNPKAHITLFKEKLEDPVAQKTEKKPKDEVSKDKDKDKEPFDRETLDDTVKSYIEDLEQKVAKAAKRGSTDEDDEPEGDEAIPESVIKSMPKHVQTMIRKQNELIEKATTAAAEAKTAAAEADKKANVEKEKRELVEFTKEADKEFGRLPGKADEKGKLLQTLRSKLTKEECDAVVKLFKAGNAGLAQMMTEDGSDSSDGTSDKSALEQLEDLAKAEMERNKDKKLSFQKAFDQVILDPENRELYQAYKAERREKAPRR